MNGPSTTFSTADLASENVGALDAILADSHPLMAEAFYLAAIPTWYDRDVLRAIRDRDDGREEGLITRLNRYSFISPLHRPDEADPAYAMRAEERSFLQRRWAREDPQAYGEAHRRALAFWQAHPDPNPFARAQHALYHRFFVDYDAGIRELISLFRTYANDRQFAAIERILAAADEASAYAALLDPEAATGIEDLLAYLRARLAQLRGRWAHSLELLEGIAPGADPGLAPYVARAYGYAFAQDGDYVQAIQKLKEALTLFDRRENAFVDVQTSQNDRAYTLIALGDAHAGLARDVQGDVDLEQPTASVRRHLRDLPSLIASLPLVLYLTPSLGWRVWRPRFWRVLRDLDWVIARLFVSAARYYRKADRLLEEHGTPGESVVADERLAYMYLALGNLQEAERLFLGLLEEEEAPLSRYHTASVRVGLAETYVRSQQPRRAAEPLRGALPVLAAYEDHELEARARDLLGQALLARGEGAEAVEHLTRAQGWYQDAEKWAEATELVENLETWEESAALTDSVREQIRDLIDGLPQREYVGVFQHRLPVYFRRLVLMLLPLVLIGAQLLAVQVETNSDLLPRIRFQPAPLLDPTQSVTTSVSLGVTTAEVTVVEDVNVVLGWAVLLIAGYLLVTLVLGLAIILLTRLHTVQARGRGATVRLDDEKITVGKGKAERSLPWTDVSRFVRANVDWWARPIRSSSALALGNGRDQLVVGGNTRHYTHLRQEVARSLPPETEILSLDYDILRSPMGILFGLNLLLLGLFNILAFVAPDVLFERPLGVIYSWADLYPYLFLGLVIPPLWWGIIQPLRQRLHVFPRAHLAVWVLSLGLLLTFFQAAVHFRPLLTVTNVYLPITAIVVLVSAAIAIWRARVAEENVYPAYVRIGAVIVAVLACALMLSVLQRDVRAYHHLVAGHALRDQALDDAVAVREAFLLEEALTPYERAAEIGSRPVWGIGPQAAAGMPLGIPAPDSFVWLAALSNQAALRVQLQNYGAALQTYTDMLAHTDGGGRVYAWRALARQGLTTTAGEPGGVSALRTRHQEAIADFDEALRIAPEAATYHLWRGVAEQALFRYGEALDSYDRALKPPADGTARLTDAQQERALTGKGWISYLRKDYVEARDLFRQAKEINRDAAEAWVGEGYALYALEQFEDVLPIWEKAAELDPRDPTILISLGTLHWKFGYIHEELGRNRCDDYAQSVDYFTQAVDRDALRPQRDEDVAYTYRTRAQVQWLLNRYRCSGPDRVDVLKEAVNSYGEAIELDPENAFYWHMRGRLSYAVWDALQERLTDADPLPVDWLFRGLDDIEKALALDPDDDLTRDYKPNAFKRLFGTALFDTALMALQRGDVRTAVDIYRRELDPAADTVDAAVRLALIAVTDDDLSEAARWFNEAVRRVSEDQEEYYTRFKPSRDHLEALWAAQGYGGDALLTEMEEQLPGQLETYPDLEENGTYWRYRAWFKYHIGLSAFLVGAEAEARALLESGQANAARAHDLATEHAYVHTYLQESAWGWYHVVRGDAYADDQDFSAALSYYEAAFDVIVPDANTTAEAEKTQAAFRAGLTALRLGEEERAVDWYERGLALLEQYGDNSEVQSIRESAADNLRKLQQEDPDAAAVAEPILAELD